MAACRCNVIRSDVLVQLVREGPLWVDLFVAPDDPNADRYEVDWRARAWRVETAGEQGAEVQR